MTPCSSSPIRPTPFTAGGGLQRFSSRDGRLSDVFLRSRIAGAQTYDRIAGYFRSSIFELLGEEIEAVEKVRIVANADVDPLDLYVSRSSVEPSAYADAVLFQRFVGDDAIVDAHLHRQRYARLHSLLTSGRLELRVVASDRAPFLHGKAGVLTGRDGVRTAFMGSVNETHNAWASNYEIVWEDTSEDGVAWVQSEFDALWRQSVALPDTVIKEVGRLAERREVSVTVLQKTPEAMAPAALVESPLYRDGENLQPWQRAFVSIFQKHRDTYGSARLILADEVGVGKTLSLAAAAMVSTLLGDGPTLILVPSTLAEQWQVELKDRLGIPSGRWHSIRKCWIDPSGRMIKSAGAADVARCPYSIGFISTGLIVHDAEEVEHLLSRRYGMVVLDEAHKARAKEDQDGRRTSQNLLSFMERVSKRTRHLILSTATPIQTKAADLWDLLQVIAGDVDWVLGNAHSPWRDVDRVVRIINGEHRIETLAGGWDLLVNPLPPNDVDRGRMPRIRERLEVPDGTWTTSRLSDSLGPLRRMAEGMITDESAGRGWFQRENPLIRHVVLRKRADLEKLGLITPLPVHIHPQVGTQDQMPRHIFDGLGIATTDLFKQAYRHAEDFTREYRKRNKAAGFMKNLLLQRICSSHAAGISTAKALLESREVDDEDAQLELGRTDIVDRERQHLHDLVATLEGSTDPKLLATRWFLEETGCGWQSMGCIVFSQYYDTASWIAEELAQQYSSDMPVALYAGAGKSALYSDGIPKAEDRDVIKGLVKDRRLRLVIATDAACEGLNLQTLGTLINVDLPWNPVRLEQRIGRIKRFGQARSHVDMANLGYVGTVDDKVLSVLSSRMQDIHAILGSIPETIRDDWIDDLNAVDDENGRLIHAPKRFDPFSIRYASDLADAGAEWRNATEVLSRNELETIMSRGWSQR